MQIFLLQNDDFLLGFVNCSVFLILFPLKEIRLDITLFVHTQMSVVPEISE